MTIETLREMEVIIQNNLADIKEGLDVEEQERALKVVELLSKQMEAHERAAMEYYDKEERRRIEEDKNRTNAELESKKSELTWKRVLFELTKVLLPTGLSIAAYEVFQKRLLKFEETGRLTSNASKGLNLPRFWK